MCAQFPLLSSPVSIGPLRLRNRVILLPHGVAYARLGEFLPTQRHVDYYAARAHGGVAMVCVESAAVSLDGLTTAPVILISDPRAVDGCRAIADAVHAAGALVQGQLTHFGNQASMDVTRRPLVGPSRLPDAALRQQALGLDRAQMDRIRDDFVAGARHFRIAGFDSVEIKIGHDGLLRQFLSPLTNDRADDYGGSVGNRLRYVLEVSAAVRDAITPDMGMSARLALDERFPGGYDLEQGLVFARALAESGLFTHITPTVGVWGSADHIVPPMTFREGYAEQAFTRAARESGLPVVATGLVRTPDYAERVLGESGVVAVGLARGLIADPDWTHKALRGAPEEIRPCTGCNQLCMGNVRHALPGSCTLNPHAGYGERRPAAPASARRVVVVGAGPAGLEAARTAAEDGCAVVVFERDAWIGGQLALAADAGRRAAWKTYLAWLRRELDRLGVEVRLGCEASVERVRELDPAVVVVACGSTPTPAAIPGGGFTSIDEFLHAPSAAGHVVLADMGLAGMPLWTAALEASLRGADSVTLVTPMPWPASDVEPTTFLDLYRDLCRQGVVMRPDHVVTARQGSTLRIAHVHTHVADGLIADVAVASTPRRSLGAELVDGLRDEVTVQVVGDALLPRDLSAAVREGQAALLAASAELVA